MRHRVTILWVAAVLAGVLCAQAAFAAGRTYIDKRREIRAGVLVLRGRMGIASPVSPYIFFIMSQRDDVKPHGWTFVNPLASGSDAFKNAASYWMVQLEQTTLENLAKFDLLYMNADQLVMFPMAERDKLRRFVDGGGCLWVDNGGGMKFADDPTTDAYDFFLPGVNFSGPTPASGPPSVVARLHPLMTSPFWLNPEEITSLGRLKGNSTYAINPGFSSSLGGGLPNPTILAPVVMVPAMRGAEPTIAAIEYGSGRVVCTSGFIGGNIEGPVANWALTPPASLTTQNSNLLRALPSDLRFAYNVVGWATAYTTHRKNYRRTGASPENVGAPLVNKWKLPGFPPVSGGSGQGLETSPVIWKNVIFYSAGSTLFALDANPEADLDMDGLPNDGFQGPADGFPAYDIIWKADNLPGSISSPTVASMLDPAGGNLVPKDFVLVTGGDGGVYIFEALPQAGDGRLAQAPVARPDLWQLPDGVNPGGSGPVLPPVVQNGWIYAVGRSGKIYGHSPVLKAAASGGVGQLPGHTWACPLVISTDPGIQANIKYGPVFGFIKNRSNGALVQMLCVVAMPPILGSSAVYNDHIYTLPVFVSSDQLTPRDQKHLVNPPGATIDFRTSYPQTPISMYPPPQVWALNPDGSSVSASFDSQGPEPGIVRINLGTNLGPNTRVYMTYALDYSLAGQVRIYAPPSLQIPPQMNILSGLQLEAGGTPALGPNDTFYFGVGMGGSGIGGSGGSGKSSVYSLWYDGKSSQLKWNYFLHGGGQVPDPSAAVNSAGLAAIEGPVKVMTGGTIRSVSNLEVHTTPAVTTDRVFVTASTKDAAVPGGYLLCFKADPRFTIRLNRPLTDPTTGRKLSVKIWQPDLVFGSGVSSQVPMLTAQAVPSEMIDYDTGAITVTDFNKIRVQGYVPTLGTTVPTGTLTPSLPVWVFVDNVALPLNQVDLSSWDNLLWSLAVPNHTGDTRCTGVSSSPMVLGDHVYFTCDDGYMFAVSVDASPQDRVTKILDPYASDSDTWLPMRDRIDPSLGAAGSNTARVTLAGAGGMLAVPNQHGLYVFNNPLTLVTDNHRVLEVGGDGKVSWACDSVYESKPASGVRVASLNATPYGLEQKSLSKPLVAQKFGPSDYLVVDSGNDRVIRMDRGGQVMWSLTRFEDPNNLLRSGEPRTLRAPADARSWAEFEKLGGELYYVIHCLVVDSGNFRILDIVNRYQATSDLQIRGPVVTDADGRPVHELNWVSHTTYRDKQFTFSSVQLVRGAEDAGGSPVEINRVWASVANYGLITPDAPNAPHSTGGGQLGGAIVSMKYRENIGAFEWKYFDGEITHQLTVLNDAGNPVPLSGPRYFAVLDPLLPRLLICDSAAVYVASGPAGDVTWKLTGEQYALLQRNITVANAAGNITGTEMASVPAPFSPQRAQMLSEDRMLIVNSYAGHVRDPLRNKFVGEVFEVNEEKTQIIWYTPEMWTYPSGELVQKMKNAPNLDQPTCAQRLF